MFCSSTENPGLYLNFFCSFSRAGSWLYQTLLFQLSLLVLGLLLGYRLCKQRQFLPLAAPRHRLAMFPGGKDCISAGGAGSAWGATGVLCHVQNHYYILAVQGILTLLLTSHASNARVVFSTVTHLAMATLTS